MLGDESRGDIFRYGPFEAVLFDCDGVLVDSRAVCRAAWSRWARRVGLDTLSVVESLEARPVREAMSELVPADQLEREVTWFKAIELRSADAVRAAPGATRAITGLHGAKWAVVTSASRVLARARLSAAAVPIPRVLVSADDVETGKPDPDCYRLAARRLGVAVDRCVAIEDSSVGACAAAGAGATVVGVGAMPETSSVHIGPVADLRSVELWTGERGEVRLRVVGSSRATAADFRDRVENAGY